MAPNSLHAPLFSCTCMCLTFEYRAAFKGHFDVIRVLAAYGANLGKVALDGNTPLHYAAQQGFGPICKFLSQRGQYLVFLYNVHVDTQYNNKETKGI